MRLTSDVEMALIVVLFSQITHRLRHGSNHGMALMRRRFKLELTPFIRYCLIGVLVTLIDLGIVYVFREMLHTRLLWAVFWGFLIANTTSFVFNKYWAFKNYSTTIVRQYTKFIIVSVTGLLLTLFLMWLFAEHWQLFMSLTPRYYLICKGLTSAIVLIWNFLSNKLWTFSREVRLFPHFHARQEYSYFLSVVIPAYNEQARIVPTLNAIIDYLEVRGLNSEVVVVDDGSTDCTSELCKQFFQSRENCRIIRSPVNRGKGFAVKLGIQNASGEYILFTDADNSTPIDEFDKFLPHLSARRVLIGSRYLQPDLVERRQPPYRVFISRAANLLIRSFVVDGVKDTQCGFKAFHHEIGETLSRVQRINRFAFDIEFLSLAQLSGLEIKEIPIRWLNSSSSRIRPIRDTIRTFGDLVRIKMNIWGRHYARTVKSVNQWKEMSRSLSSNTKEAVSA